MEIWRQAMPKTWFLLPGYGAQGASADDCMAGFNPDGTGGLVVSARGVLFRDPLNMTPISRTDTWMDGVYDRAVTFREDIAEAVKRKREAP